jgi:hypothetical protein
MKKILVTNFKGQVLPMTNVDVVNTINYPMLAFPMPPKGIKIYIRAGVPFLEDGRRLRNQYFYEAVHKVLHKSRCLKATVEATLITEKKVSDSTIVMALLSLDIDLDQFNLVLTDMVFEHTPSIRASVRTTGLASLFRETEVDNCVSIADFNNIENPRELASFLNRADVLNNSKITVLNPNAAYHYDTVEDLVNGPGVCMDLKQTFRSKIIDIIPKLVKKGWDMVFIADYILAKDRGVEVKIPVNVCNELIWKHRKNYIGKFFLYEGVVTPTENTPVSCEFLKVVRV